MSYAITVIVGTAPIWVLVYVIFFLLGPWEKIYNVYPAQLPLVDGELHQAVFALSQPDQWALFTKWVWMLTDDQALHLRLTVRRTHKPLTIPWKSLRVRGIYKRYIKGMGEDIVVIELESLPTTTLLLDRQSVVKSFPKAVLEGINLSAPFPPMARLPGKSRKLVLVVMIIGLCLVALQSLVGHFARP